MISGLCKHNRDFLIRSAVNRHYVESTSIGGDKTWSVSGEKEKSQGNWEMWKKWIMDSEKPMNLRTVTENKLDQNFSIRNKSLNSGQ